MAEQSLPISKQQPPVHMQPRNGLWASIKAHRHAYLFISPFYILFAIFGLWPMLFSLYLSFTNWNGRAEIEFTGFSNFQRLMRDTVFWQSFENGVILFFLYVPAMLLVALVLAVVLNSKYVRGFRIFRTIIFMPFITNMVAAGFAFQILLNQNNGLFNVMLTSVGIPAVPWLESMWGARISLALMITWAWLGYNMVLMLAGLQTIPKDLTEAARVDGANRVQAFIHITIPLMRPIILFATVMSTIGSFGLFTEVMTLTGGGPMNATITPLVKIYNNAFQQFQFGYASTMAYTYFVIIMIFTLVQMRYIGRDGEE
jgi:lactose/L-arabinose transport system permease protein